MPVFFSKFNLFVLLFTFISCPKAKVIVHDAPQIKPIAQQVANRSIVKEESYIVFLKKTLPQIPQGTGYTQVQKILKLDQKFNGLVFSSGDKKNFRYTFELNAYQLQLSFDYTKTRDGSYKEFLLTPLS